MGRQTQMRVLASSACVGMVCLSGAPAVAGPTLDQLIASAEASFPSVPRVRLVTDISGVCGEGAEGLGVYCSSENRIYLVQSLSETPRGTYTLAHLYGHAMQVRYGIADIALSTIRANRDREPELRGMVTRQVECFAGLLTARAGLPAMSFDNFAAEPFTGSHWGRNPVRNGPRVSIGTAARAHWYATGYQAADPAACSVGEMSADLIVRADRGR